MQLSGSEIMALATKAARGAGLPLGHAEDIGQAAVRLAANGRLDELPGALSGPFEPVVVVPAGRFPDARVAIAGPTALDLVCAGAGPVYLGSPDAPALLRALAEGCVVAIRVEERPEGLELAADPDATGRVLPPALGPYDIDAPVLEALNELAANTYVPATEASRLAGAGAGLTDND